MVAANFFHFDNFNYVNFFLLSPLEKDVALQLSNIKIQLIDSNLPMLHIYFNASLNFNLLRFHRLGRFYI